MDPASHRIHLTLEDMAKGPSRLLEIAEASVNRAGVSVFVPPVGYFASLDNSFFERDVLINPPPAKQLLDNGATVGTYQLTSVAYSVVDPVTVIEPVPVVVPAAAPAVPLSGVQTRSRRAGNDFFVILILVL